MPEPVPFTTWYLSSMEEMLLWKLNHQHLTTDRNPELEHAKFGVK
jgi:hypothetical protein